MVTEKERIHAQLTLGFIDDNPRDIAFTRMKKVKTSAGGFRNEPDAVLVSQRGRLVKASSRGQTVSRLLPDGRIISPTATLVFARDVDVKRYDKTVIDGVDYEVIFVSVGPWSIEAEVTSNAE